MEADRPSRAALSDSRRALLQRYLRGGAARAAHGSKIPRRNPGEPTPLSFSQQQIWLHAQLAGEALIYNEPITIHRHGSLDRDALELAFTEIVRRHEAWRTTFEWASDRAVQVVQPPPERIQIPWTDLRAHPAAEHEALRLATEEVRQPFDLSRGPMYRLRLVSLGENDHRFYLALHHIIFDGVSLYHVLLPELITAYEAFAKHRAPALPALPIQYPDFAAWQRSLPNETSRAPLAYWEPILADAPVLDLLTDRPRPATQTYAGAIEQFEIPASTSKGLQSLGQEYGATSFMTMVAAFVALMHGYTGAEDIVVGGISSGRRDDETMGLLGCFLNTVPIRCAFSKDLPFTELLARVRASALGALSHDEVPFETLVQNFAERDPSRSPLVQVLVVVEPPLAPLPNGWIFRHMDVDPGTAKFDLQLGLDDRAEGMFGQFIYNTDLFEQSTIVLLKTRWLQLLDRIATSPQDSVSSLTTAIWQATERPLPPPEWNATQTDYPRDKSIHRLFEEKAALNPLATALIFGAQSLSYDQLNRRGNRLARRLQQLGAHRDQPIGVCCDRSVEMIVALLAILKAGGAYAPLDPTYPAERLAWLISDTGASVILTQSRFRNLLGSQVKLVCLDEEDCEAENESNLTSEVRAEDLAYLIYTSGSTGTPKGVAVPHRAVVRLVRATNYASFAADEIFLQLAPLAFDASTFEIWGPLLNGAKLIIMPSAPATLAEIGEAIRRHGVTTLWLTAALFNAMVDEGLSDLRPLRQLLAGGDVLSAAHVAKALRELKNTRLINGYGPTESTTFACCFDIPPSTSPNDSIPIGRPIANTTAYILGVDSRPVPVGVTGKLHLGGDGLARGYWQREDLTVENFISDPFSKNIGARLYKTGDLARWRADGQIEFLGRADQQIKVRGFRIEPGEIETALKNQAGVRDAAVIAREDKPNEKRLLAYVVGSATGETLLAALRKSLPAYMIPSAIISLNALPRTANGKLDRRALPAPVATDGRAGAITPLEEKLAVLWQGVLGLECVGRSDNFFELGGHSLLGLRLVNQLREAMGEPLSLSLIFEAPTVAEMAVRLTTDFPERVAHCLTENEKGPANASSLDSIVPINRESRRARRA